jgi:anti-sigma28 factor (negative regulator of flagellin synthesis)
MGIERISGAASGNIQPIDPVRQKDSILKMDRLNASAQAKDVVEISQEARLAHELARVQTMMAEVPEPNAARLVELKEKIDSGTYLTKKVMGETAGIVMSHLLR